MNKVVLLASIVGALAPYLQGQPNVLDLRTAEPFQAMSSSASPRLSELRADIDAGKAANVDEFWAEVEAARSPLIEAAPEDQHASLVTFVWRGDEETRNVVLIGGVAGTDLVKNGMTNIEGSDVWYKTYQIRNDARFIYSFSENDSFVPIEKIDPKDRAALNKRISDFRPDPLNPRRDPGGMPSSYVELSEAPAQPWTTPVVGVAQGKVQKLRFRSTILENERDVWVYTPTGYSSTGRRYPLLIVFDGSAYISTVPTPVILDNLIGKGLIPPMVAISIGNATASSRAVELPCSADFADFLAGEVAPWMRRNYNATDSAEQVAVGGSSFGGLASVFAAFRHPDVFGKVLSQSGSFWWKPVDRAEPEWLTAQIENSPKLPTRLFMEVGLMENGASLTGPSLLTTNRHLRDVLEAKGYALRYKEFNGGHEYLNWRGSFADGLLYLFSDDTANAGL